MAQVSAHDVAAELRRLLPGLPVKKLHKLLYYCQGHHLAHFDEPLFAEPVMAWDMGPVVANLWKQEKEGVAPTASRALDLGQLNTVSYVVSRYGRLSGADLERLTHAEEPWIAADTDRQPGGTAKITDEAMRDFFLRDEEDQRWPSREAIASWLADAASRRDHHLELHVDSLDEVRQRLSALG